ncbi:MAG: amidase [Bacteroidia bacterium]
MARRALVTQKLAYPDATALRMQLQSGEITSEQLVKEHLDRLAIYNKELNAATEIFREDALALAKNPMAGKLSGIPVSVKETYGMAGKMVTQGSKRSTPAFSPEDAYIVKRLKEEGAIIIARTNIPEFAMTPECDNLLYGRTNNPLNLDRTCGGSSGGEGALVGSGCSVLGIGSDIGGSVRYPASFCGVVGFKPASASINKTGMYPIVQGNLGTMLAAGPLTRSVRDARLVYNLVTDKPLPDAPMTDFSKLNLFYPQIYRKKLADPEISEAVGNTHALLLQAGLQKTHGDFSDATELIKAYNQLIIAGFEGEMHASLMGGEKGKRISLMQESWLQMTGKPTVHTHIFQMLVGMSALRPSPKQVQAATDLVENARKKYNEMLGENGIWVLPSVGCLAPKHGNFVGQLRTLGIAEAMKPTILCNILNLPCITLPAWKYKNESTGLVPGVTLVSKAGSEHQLLSVAQWLEDKI